MYIYVIHSPKLQKSTTDSLIRTLTEYLKIGNNVDLCDVVIESNV